MLGATLVLLLAAAPLGLATINLTSRQTDHKAVFAHFIVGIVQNFALDDWIAEMTTAKATGIDGFVLNCAPPRVNSYTPTQMSLAYQAAQQIPGGFSVFPSFDFSYWSNGDTSTIVQLLQNYSGESSQALYDGRPIVSTFVGESFDWDNVRSAGIDVFAIPMLEDPNQLQDPNSFDGAFSWYAWPTNGSNSIIPGPITTYWDNLFETNLAKADLDQIYMARFLGLLCGMSADALTRRCLYRLGSSRIMILRTGCVFIAEQLITDRWPQVLVLQPQLVELVTWNDYGESHYIADFEPDHTDDGSAEWAAGYPHAGWRSITKAFIAAYKAGTTEPVVDQEEVVYWYRSFLKNTPCTGDTLGVPSGVSLLSDSVFVTTLLTSPAVLTVTSGSQAPVSFNVPAGVTSHNVSMGIGAQTFSISRNGVEIASGTGGLQIADTCTIFNYNAYYHDVDENHIVDHKDNYLHDVLYDNFLYDNFLVLFEHHLPLLLLIHDIFLGIYDDYSYVWPWMYDHCVGADLPHELYAAGMCLEGARRAVDAGYV
ncbi:hypothetical protein HMN09_00151200 [Mycena chlorophos]|uniref:Glycoside hydrolase family 71 protein n=1 Tax=Mycena chlorophos TaxID=658473 RepID=A0A8H6TMU5_MYCCL|nr:hypothetical protein HMN09_00151200 [Mycena chlorophos]